MSVSHPGRQEAVNNVAEVANSNRPSMNQRKNISVIRAEKGVTYKDYEWKGQQEPQEVQGKSKGEPSANISQSREGTGGEADKSQGGKSQRMQRDGWNN